MKAVQVHQPGPDSHLSIEEVSTPEPAKSEIQVKIKATALNRADLLQRSGNYPPPKDAPNILGLEMAGIVTKTGENVSRWKEGDNVFSLLPGGGYAEYCTIPEKMAIPVPPNLSFEQAAAIPETFLTAFQSLFRLGKLKQDESALIHAGGSGVGTAAIQLTRQLFKARVATTASKKKLATCADLGAEITINYHEKNFAEVIEKIWGDKSIDLIIDFIGAPYWHQNLQVLNHDGRLIYLSFLGGSKPADVNLAPLLQKRISVMGSTLRSRSDSYKINLTSEFRTHTYDLFANETIRPIIDKVYDWQHAEQAHTYMRDNKNIGKILLTGI